MVRPSDLALLQNYGLLLLLLLLLLNAPLSMVDSD